MVSPQPGPSGERPAKRAKTSANGGNVNDGWKEVKIDLDLKTGFNFTFLPRKGREPGINENFFFYFSFIFFFLSHNLCNTNI